MMMMREKLSLCDEAKMNLAREKNVITHMQCQMTTKATYNINVCTQNLKIVASNGLVD